MRYPAFTRALMTSTLLAGAAFADGAPFHDPMVVKLPAPAGEQVLLYPGGQYGRIIPWGLKQPETAPAPITLRRPKSHPYAAAGKPEHRLALHRPVHHSARHAAPATAVARSAPEPAATVQPEHRAPQKPVRVAKAEPAPRHTHTPFYARRGNAGRRIAQIAFQQSASQPSGTGIDRINALSDQLDDAVSGRSRVQILAYAGVRNNHSSSARRLSLKRALIVRQLLIDNGVPSDRIDVRAMGGVTDNGVNERVDIYLKN